MMPRVTPTSQGVSPTSVPITVASNADGYVAVAPRILRSGQKEKVALSVFSGNRAGSDNVRVTLSSKDGRIVNQASGGIQGRGEITLDVPSISEGDYELRVTGTRFDEKAPIRVEDGTLVFVETDKPIYKPGQTIHVRVLTLDPSLKPVAGPVTVEIADAKGIKIFKKDVRSDDYGMTSFDVPLSTEPNLGTWKISATTGKRSSEVDVRVERYVLPKYEVKVNLAKDWVLASDPIKGTVTAEYSYGKPVQGEAIIKASRYVGAWQEFASVTRDLSDSLSFELPAVKYVSGVPGARGMGNVQIDVTVREKSTGYEEKTSQLIPVAASPVLLQAIPESVTFKPGLPLSVLLIAETPDKKPTNAQIQLNVYYTKSNFQSSQETQKISVTGGKAIAKIQPPSDAISLSVQLTGPGTGANLNMQAGYSPTGSFINVEQVSSGSPKVGDTAQFRVNSTKQAVNFYYEVVARGSVVFSGYSQSPDIAFTLTPLMAPSSRLLVYQILPSSEVAADYVPFAVSGDYPQKVDVSVSSEEARPGDKVDVTVQAEGDSRVGLAAVDRSVFILAENRLNLQQVFDELERLYQTPQAELHEARPFDKIVSRGAKDVFTDAGLVVLSSKNVPAGKTYELPVRQRAVAPMLGAVPAAEDAKAAGAPQPTTVAAVDTAQGGGLAEVQRVRQFFPETWIWTDLQTDSSGRVAKQFDAPDSITTWMLRAVALSKQSGLGIGEAQLKVLQPFFAQIDLPYSVIRGEEFPVRVALYNYTSTGEPFQVDLEQSDWFDLVGASSQTVTVGANDVAGATFTIRPTKLGVKTVKITARSKSNADAIVKEIIVEPEGVARELVENAVIPAGSSRELDAAVPGLGAPGGIVEGSARALVSITGSYLSQTIQGLESLIRMPFGCGEQNMILFAPNVFVSKYLKETNQLKPEVMAKAETMMVTGYQRELTYRRQDGSFSAFGDSDKDGSLWLTAFVMKTFAQSSGLIYVDDAVISSSRTWIGKQQKADGSFAPVGFVHHEDLLGGLKGNTALTAYVVIALLEAGDKPAADRAIAYLEGQVDAPDVKSDAYTTAISAYALTLAKSGRADAAVRNLMALAKQSTEGTYWGDDVVEPQPLTSSAPAPRAVAPIVPPRPNQSASIETTGYAALALLGHGDRIEAGNAAKWLVSKRNAYGGFSSTQDTVVGLQALTAFATQSKSDVDATVKLSAPGFQKEVSITPANADVVQVVEAPVGGPLTVEVSGKGQPVVQLVRRFNVPSADEKAQSAFKIDVSYSATDVEVDDQITVNASVQFTPPEPIKAGMVVVDVAVPTGFAPVTETLDALKDSGQIKRYDVAGRKVILYIEDMDPGDKVELSFKARGLYPVKAQPVTSAAYSYYRPELRGESLGSAVSVSDRS